MQDGLSSLTRGSNSHSLQWKCRMSTSGPPGKPLTCAFFSGELLLTDSCYQAHRCLGSYRSFWGQPLANDLQMCDYHKPVSLSLGRIRLCGTISLKSLLWDGAEARQILSHISPYPLPLPSCFPYSSAGFFWEHSLNNSSVQESLFQPLILGSLV